MFAAWVGMMAWSQDELIFPIHAVAPPDPLPPGAQRLNLQVADGNALHGVHIPPSDGADASRTLVFGFGGNAWNGDNVASYLHGLYPQADVVAFHYRGYAPSTGRPSADALIEDAPHVLDLAIERVKPERVVAVGFSIGSGVAASLVRSRAGESANTGSARRRELDGLILVTPFDSMKLVAQDLYPWLPGISLLFRHELNAIDDLAGSRVPVAIIAADRDEIIPRRRTESLREKVPNLVFDRTIAGVGHNDIYGRPEFQQAMREALEAVTAGPRPD